MNKMAIVLLLSLMSGPIAASEPYVILDLSKVDARQYCIYNGQLYTRGVRIKTDTGTYSCRVANSEQAGQGDTSKETLSWVRETI